MRCYVDDWRNPGARHDPEQSWTGVTILGIGDSEREPQGTGEEPVVPDDPEHYDPEPWAGALPPECADPTRVFRRRADGIWCHVDGGDFTRWIDMEIGGQRRPNLLPLTIHVLGTFQRSCGVALGRRRGANIGPNVVTLPCRRSSRRMTAVPWDSMDS